MIIATRQGQIRVTSCTKIEGKASTILGRADGEWGKYCELESESVVAFGYQTVPVSTLLTPTRGLTVSAEASPPAGKKQREFPAVQSNKETQPGTVTPIVSRVNRSTIAGFSIVAGVGGGVLVALGAAQEAHLEVGASQMSKRTYDEARTQTNRTYLAGYISLGVSTLGVTWALAW